MRPSSGVFSAEAFIEFERYISGLDRVGKQDGRWDQPAVCRRKPQSEFAEPPADRKSLLAGGLEPGPAWPVGQSAGTRLKPKGVLSVDDTLLTHYGQDFEQIAQL